MILPIMKRDGELEEWAIVELQGDLKFDSPSDITYKYIGDLHFFKSGTAAVLVIGIHVLHGKQVPLAKPYAVLMKRNNNSQEEGNIEHDSRTIKTEYIVQAIVKKKLIFKMRPKPIVTNVPRTS